MAAGETVTLRTKMKPGIARRTGSPNIVQSSYVKTPFVKTTGELVTAQDSTVYLRVGPTLQANNVAGSGYPRGGIIVAVPYADVLSVKFTGKENRSWVLPVILLEVVPAVALGLTAMSVEDNTGGDGLGIMFVASIPTLLNWVLFESGSRRNASPKPDIVIGQRLDRNKLEIGSHIAVWHEVGGKSLKRKGYIRDIDEDGFTISSKRGYARRIAYEDVVKVHYAYVRASEFEALRKYARFPQGLSATQMDRLLKSHNQETPGSIR